MVITYNNKNISFKYYYIIVIILLLLLDDLLLNFIYGQPPPGQQTVRGLTKVIVPLGFLLAIFNLNKLSPFLRNWSLLILLYLLVIVLESYYNYNSFFIYPHVFSKILLLFLIPCTYAFFRDSQPKYLSFLIFIIIVAFILQAALFKRGALSAAAFVETKRGFTAPTTYFLLLPCLFFFNKYLTTRKFILLFSFFAVISFILFLQHRTVWLSTIAAFIVNIYLLRKTTAAKVNVGTVSPIFIIPVIAGFLLSAFVLSTQPELVDKFIDRADDITNYETEGTGSWRYQQTQSYLPFIEENLTLGMRLKGFELPIQFYHPESGLPYFPDETGHHFHSFYVDRLFYFGIVGLILIVPIFVYLFKKIIQKEHFTSNQVILISYAFSGIVYGISYNWPDYFYGFIGMALAFLDNEEVTNDNL